MIFCSMFEDVPRIFFPVLYFTQTVPMTDELASEIALLQNLPQISNIFCLSIVILGALLASWAVLSYICCRTKKYNNEYKVPHNPQEEVPLGTWNGGTLTPHP